MPLVPEVEPRLLARFLHIYPGDIFEGIRRSRIPTEVALDLVAQCPAEPPDREQTIFRQRTFGERVDLSRELLPISRRILVSGNIMDVVALEEDPDACLRPETQSE